MHNKTDILLLFAVGMTFAFVLAYIAQRIRLSPIFGYLIAGYFIGPYSPGYVADLTIAEQLAEIGVILMLFSVGMHFKWEDLHRVRGIAVPGAIVQTLAATLCTTAFIFWTGWSLSAGLITGLSIGVASTVILVKMLEDYKLLHKPEGQIAVGWLVVEDIFTVLILLLLPTLADFLKGNDYSTFKILSSIAFLLLKFCILIVIMFTIGQKIVSKILTTISRLHSHEMFTLAVLALVFMIATSSAVIFGTSIPLGAFIAGMVIGRTRESKQAAANALPLKDIFSITFFLAVGMLFNPEVIYTYALPFFGILAIILIVKPLSAYFISRALGCSLTVALTVAIALGQIGEFSFILAEEATRFKILPDETYDIIVACALVSIAINPLLFQTQNYLTHKAK